MINIDEENKVVTYENEPNVNRQLFPNIPLTVDVSPLEEEIEVLGERLDTAEDDITDIKGQLLTYNGQPEVTSTAAGMTDQDKIYVYTGSETGYTNGDWYYYNGTAWVSGGAYVANPVQIDDTLTQSGDAADAKVTGDEIAQIKSDFDAVITYNESENILDPDTSIIVGYYVPNGGGFSDNSSFRTIDYVPVIGGKYLISSNQNGYLQARFIVEYDANKNVINAASESTEGTGDGKHYTSAYLLLNSITRYVRITYRTTSLLLDTIMLSLSDDYALPEFQPYFDPYYAIKPDVLREYVKLPMHIYAEDGISSFYAKMTEAYTSRNRDVYIHKGDYVYTNAIIEQIRSDGRRGVPIGNGCRYFFETGANIYCEYTGSNAEDIYTLFSPLDSQNVASDYELHNLKIVAKNVLYAVHDEANGQNAFCKHVYKDCYIELDNTDIGESSTYLSKAIGGGLGKHEEIIIENCVFKAINPGKTTNAQQDVSYHGANNSTFSDVHIVLTGCYFITGVFRCGNIAANTEAPYPRVIYTNNSANGGESIDALWDKYVWNNINRLTS